MLQKTFFNRFKKKKTFYSEKGRQLHGKFCFFVFSLQTKKDSALFELYFAALFSKILGNFRGNVCDGAILSKVSVLQIWLTHRRLPINFLIIFLWLLQTLKRKAFLCMMTLLWMMEKFYSPQIFGEEWWLFLLRCP